MFSWADPVLFHTELCELSARQSSKKTASIFISQSGVGDPPALPLMSNERGVPGRRTEIFKENTRSIVHVSSLGLPGMWPMSTNRGRWEVGEARLGDTKKRADYVGCNWQRHSYLSFFLWFVTLQASFLLYFVTKRGDMPNIWSI